MKEWTNPIITSLQEELELSRQCCQLLQMKSRALEQNDLLRLEEIIGQEAQWLSQMMKSGRAFQNESLNSLRASHGDVQNQPQCIQGIQFTREEQIHWKQLGESLKQVACELQQLKLKHQVLIDNGLQFTQSLWNAICPPPAYGPSSQPDLSTAAQRSSPSIISLQY
jgi:hypothetical protein